MREKIKLIALKNAINKGLENGIVIDFDAKKHLEFLKQKKLKSK